MEGAQRTTTSLVDSTMVQAIGIDSDRVQVHTNEDSKGTLSSGTLPIGTTTPHLSTTRGHQSAMETPHPTTPATPPNGDHLSASSGSNRLIDREERTVAALLTRFKALVTLAAEPIQDGATKEVAAAHGLQMEVEGSALVRATEDLLQLTRELKELWLFGPLRGIKEGEGEGQMDVDSQKVGELVEAVLKKAGEHPPAT